MSINLLANCISNIKTCLNGRLPYCVTSKSGQIISVLNIFYKLGYIYGFTILPGSKVKVYLKYFNNRPVIRQIFLVSVPSRKVYLKYRSVYGALVGNNIYSNGFYIISTNKGIFTDIESTLLHSGGEALLYIY